MLLNGAVVPFTNQSQNQHMAFYQQRSRVKEQQICMNIYTNTETHIYMKDM